MKKKILQTIKIRKFKTKLNEESLKPFENKEFLIWYRDNTCEEVYFKDELIHLLSNDHKKPIRYIFDLSDRIIIDRDIHVDISEVIKND